MRTLVCAMALFLPACTNTLNFTPTMASDPPELGVEGIALANELSRAYVRQASAGGICGDVRMGYQQSRRYPVTRYRNGQRDADDLFECVFFREYETDILQQEAVTRHVQAGLALSDYFCANFFDRIAEHLGKRRFARNVTNDVGTMVSTILGLAAAGSGVTGGIGAAFGLADSTWRNYDDSFLVDADLPTLQGLVLSEQAKFRRDLTMPDNYPDATNTILRYANLCSFVGMRRLLTESMRDRTDENDTVADSPENLVRARAEAFMETYEAFRAARDGEASAEDANDRAEESDQPGDPG